LWPELGSNVEGLIIGGLVALFVLIVLARTIRIVPQARAGIVERFGRYTRTLGPGLAIVIPFVDRLKPLLDLREQVVSFSPQPVITEDNLVVQIDSVIYFQVTDPKAATYEIENYIHGVEQLTITTLRNVVGGMDLEDTLTSREEINLALRGVLDEATGKWGIRVNRVELKSIEPPPSVQESMEKQMRAERDKRASILTAEGAKRSAILTAEGYKESAVLTAQGQAEAEVLKATGEAEAIKRVFNAVNTSDVNESVLAYQYLQALPALANGTANKVWFVPAELTKAMSALGGAFDKATGSTESDN
jgi:regulator of protease activity HflC (stomatin/prohibitin superfamily)